MGHIKKVLASQHLEPRSITPRMIWVDLCENIHIHYRNFRFDMSKQEFATWMCAMNCLYKASEYSMHKFKFEEGDPNNLKQLQFRQEINNNSDYYPNRAVLEWNRDDTYHFHYRDFRLHMSEDEFEDIAGMFVKGLEQKKAFQAFGKKYSINGLREPKCMEVEIEDVQPYDAGHKPGGHCFDITKDDATDDHESGIEACMELIKAGKRIRPILVASDGQRLDGYKRYMAFKRLGYKRIPVIVDPQGRMGGQDGMSWELEAEEEAKCASS